MKNLIKKFVSVIISGLLMAVISTAFACTFYQGYGYWNGESYNSTCQTPATGVQTLKDAVIHTDASRDYYNNPNRSVVVTIQQGIFKIPENLINQYLTFRKATWTRVDSSLVTVQSPSSNGTCGQQGQTGWFKKLTLVGNQYLDVCWSYLQAGSVLSSP